MYVYLCFHSYAIRRTHAFHVSHTSLIYGTHTRTTQRTRAHRTRACASVICYVTMTHGYLCHVCQPRCYDN